MARIDPPSSIDGGSPCCSNSSIGADGDQNIPGEVEVEVESEVAKPQPVEANIVQAFACCNKILTTPQLVNLIQLTLPYAQSSKEGKKCFHVIGIVSKIPNGMQYLSVEQVTPSKVANELREKEFMLTNISRELRLDEICSKLGIELVIFVRAGTQPQRIVVEEALKSGATVVVLEREMKKHTQYIKAAPLSCGVVRLKDGGGVEVIRSPSIKLPYTSPAVVSAPASPPRTPNSPGPRPRSPPPPPAILSRRGSWISGSGRRSLEHSPRHHNNLQAMYDVFISHRGTVKNGFVGYLDAALHNLLVHSFLDRKDLGVGEYIWDRLQAIIEQVPVSLVIFTADFAGSPWCLEELYLMVQNRPRTQILPVFYDVNPSDVRRPSQGALKEGWAKTAGRISSVTKEKYKSALETASNIVGWQYSSSGHILEADLVYEIAKQVSEMVPVRPSHADEVLDANQRQVPEMNR